MDDFEIAAIWLAKSAIWLVSFWKQFSGYNGIWVFICTDAWAPICIFLHESGQNESVQLKPIGTLYILRGHFYWDDLHITSYTA